MTQDEIIPLHIEDEYVRNYLWERALIAIDDPCTKSHPHENMNEYCQHKTKDEPVAWEQFYPDIGKPQIAFNAEVVGYVAPQSTWVGLTDEDLKLLSAEWRIVYGAWMDDFARDIEAKLKEKNHGN